MNVTSITSPSGSALAALSGVDPTGATPLVPGSSTQTTPAQRQKAAQQFEAILVRQLLSQSVGSMMGGLGHTAGLMYGDLMTNTLAQNLTAGKGLGLGKLIETQLAPRGAAAAAKVVAKPIQRP
jgi:Rod binding domain-containing protein